MKRYSIVALLLAAALSQSCLEEKFTADGIVFEPDRKEISVAPYLESGAVLRDTVRIRTNKSWYASIVESCDWIELSDGEKGNHGGAVEEHMLVLTFDNSSLYTDRSVTLRLAGKGFECLIPVTQTRKVPFIDLLTPAVFDNVNPEGQTVKIAFRSNVDWTVSPSGTPTADYSLNKTSGSGSDSLEVTFTENMDFVNAKTLDLQLKGDALEPVDIKFTQTKAVPYVHFIEESNRYEISAGGENLPLYVKANVSWSAEITEGLQYIQRVKSGKTETTDGKFTGTKGTSVSFTLYSDGQTDVNSAKPVRIAFTPQDGEPVTMELTVTAASHLIFPFIYPTNGLNWFLSSPSTSEMFPAGTASKTPAHQGEVVDGVLRNGMHLKFSFPDQVGSGTYYNSKSFGIRNAGAYIEFPAIEGKALRKIRCIAGYTNKMKVTDASGATVQGGAGFDAAAAMDDISCTLSGTLPGTSYRLESANGACEFRTLEIWYE